jgi:hypothetical protein
MTEEFLKYFLVYISSTIKFIFGPTIGIASGFNVFITGTLTTLGMMTSVYVFSFFGDKIHAFRMKILGKKERKLFTKKSRRFVNIWNKYGVAGIAVLTPIILTPIGGTILVNAVGAKKEDIFKYMWISCIFWSYSITWAIKFASEYISIEEFEFFGF